MGMHGLSFSGELSDGTAVTKDMKGHAFPSTVWVNPAPGSPSGDTVSVWYSVNGGTTYTLWSAGAVSEYTESVFDAPITNLKFQRTAGSGVSQYGVC